MLYHFEFRFHLDTRNNRNVTSNECTNVKYVLFVSRHYSCYLNIRFNLLLYFYTMTYLIDNKLISNK